MFYTFSQNNSGGSFDVNDNVAEYVIIEADSPEEANDKAKEIGIYFEGCFNGMDCDCCGDRWYPVSEYEGAEKPEIYGKSVEEWTNKKDSFSLRDKVIVYSSDGKKVYNKVK